MAEQKALLVTEPGNKVVLGTRHIPTPGPKEVLVKISIAGLNPHDRLVRDLGYFIGKNVPAPFGVDLVGTVQALGKDVDNFKIGDLVFGNGDPFIGDYMATQEYALMDVDFMGRVPSSVTQDEAATLPLNALTMYIALFDPSTHAIPSPLTPAGQSFDYKNTPIVIIGGGSNCGKFAIQLAKWAGFGTIIAVAGKPKASYLLELGATQVIDRTLGDDAIESEVRSIVGDSLLHVCTAVLAKDQTLGARLLSNNEKGILVPLTAGEVDETKLSAKKAGYEVRRFLCRPHAADKREVSATFWKAFPGLVEKGILRPTQYAVIKGLDESKVNEVLDQYRDFKDPTRPNVHVSEI
ncbi:alcohol dehydrogenase, zinc-containing [Trichoderma arundinaceum]|uniref:Alcohol dehydrogenase, zinc-containing n=1 Tax=Trichoderma arundinaceum TaxID=490622 RepID=A0A395NRB6_TRIAR|nr:alcohol dehydrogenase, zinc-containing [Trichoderma arundinaceum]